MRRLLVLSSISALIATFATVNAQGLFGFRLLKLDGEHVVWSTWQGEPKVTHVTYAYVRTRTGSTSAINCQTIGPIDPILERSNFVRTDFRTEVRDAMDIRAAGANTRVIAIDVTTR